MSSGGKIKMVDINRSLKKMMGKSLNIPKFGIPTKRDWDGDGIPNFRDCHRGIWLGKILLKINME